MGDQFVMCARAVKKGQFISEPGPTRYLRVPDGQLPTLIHEIKQDAWFKEVQKAAIWRRDPDFPEHSRGDLLFFVHGYNNSQDVVMKRHRRITNDLGRIGYKGAVASFDWPSSDKALNYLEDRHDAKKTSMRLVTDGIKIFAALQTPNCCLNVHLMGHSTGAYVIREAFDDADDSKLDNNAWTVSQIIFIGADLSASSMSGTNAVTESLYRHCTRLTNYSNLHDSVLKLSNAKRVGVAPRVGRVGMPKDIPGKAVNVDCTAYFEALSSNAALKEREQSEEIGSFNHSWHIGNTTFARDMFETLIGDSDRTVISTREKNAEGTLVLRLP